MKFEFFSACVCNNLFPCLATDLSELKVACDYQRAMGRESGTGLSSG